MHDVIVVGSGVAATGAIVGLVERGLRPLVLDVGYRPSAGEATVHENFYDYKDGSDSFRLTIGANWRGLANHLTPHHVPVKLTAPHMEYVTRHASQLAPLEEDQFSAIQSFSMGGLANAWGAGLYRLTDGDLVGFPFRATDLDPHFDRLTEMIGISGADDDLTPFFGPAHGLLPALRLSRNIGRFYENYRRQRRLPASIHVGHPRIAVLSVPHGGRPALTYDNLEFWQESRAIYTPRYTLESLIASDRIDYQPGMLVERWEEASDTVTVLARDVEGGGRLRFDTKRLLLAAGAINTSKIVLHSFDDYDTRLPLLENPAIQIPFVMPRFLGRELERDAFGLVGLNLVWESETYGALCQGSIMEITAPMRAEFFSSLPYAARSNLDLIRYLVPAMIVMQFYLPGSAQEPAWLSALPDGRLRIDGHPNHMDLAAAGPLLAFFRRLGAWTHRSLIVRVPTGHAVHYAATLPMRHHPGRYECDPSGRLTGTQHVYVADSAGFTALPAKNMSFGMMANAMRVATGVADHLG